MSRPATSSRSLSKLPLLHDLFVPWNAVAVTPIFFLHGVRNNPSECTKSSHFLSVLGLGSDICYTFIGVMYEY